MLLTQPVWTTPTVKHGLYEAGNGLDLIILLAGAFMWVEVSPRLTSRGPNINLTLTCQTILPQVVRVKFTAH